MIKKQLLLLLFVLATPILWGQNPELTLQTGHSAPVTTMAFNQDGTLLATAGADNIIIIWDFRLGKQLKVLKGHSQKINAIQFLHHNNQLISAGNDGQILFWNIEEGSIKESIQMKQPVLSFDISENDAHLIATGIFSFIRCWKISEKIVFDKDITLWSSADSIKYFETLLKKSGIKKSYKKTGKLMSMFSQIYKPIPAGVSVVFGSNETEIIAARAISLLSGYNFFSYFDTKMLSWDGSEKMTIPCKANIIYHKIEKAKLFISCVPSRISCFDPIKEKVTYTRSGDFRKKNFISISLNANDSILTAVNEDGNIYKWKSSGAFLQIFADPLNIYTSVVFHPLHKNILIAGNKSGDVVVIDISNNQIVRKLESGIHPIVQMAVNPEGSYIALGGSDHFISSIFLDNKISIMGFSGHQGKVTGMHFVSDTMLVSSGSDNRIAFSNMKTGSTAKIKGNHNPRWYNAIANAPLYTVFLNTITSFDYARKFLWGNFESQDVSAVSPNRKYYASGGKGFNKGILYRFFAPRIFPIHLINTAELKKEKVIGAHYKSIDCIGFNYNSSIFACSGRDYKTGAPALSKKFSKNMAISLLVPVLGMYLAVKTLSQNTVLYDSYNSLKIWDLQQTKPIKTFDFQYEIKSFCFSPVNDTMLIADEKDKILIFDYKRDSVKVITSGKGPLLYASDGKSFLFQDQTHSMVKFDIEQQKITSKYTGHSDSLTGAAFITGGKQLVTSSLDGSMKIWDINSGKEIATLFTMNNSDFIIKTPDYFYYSTKNAKKEIGFTFGLKFYPFEQFDLQYNRPDIVMERLGCATPEMVKALHMAYAKRLQKSGFTEEMFANDFHLPEIVITEADKIPVLTENSSLTFTLVAKDSKYYLDRMNVWVNDVAVFGSQGFSLRDKNLKEFSREITLTLSQGTNKVRVSCMNEKGVESLRETVEIICTSAGQAKPDLYVIAIGASEYADPEWNLSFAAKDASDVISLFENQKNNYGKITTRVILNKDVTIGNIKKVKELLSNTKVDDKVLVFYAGHGLLDENLDYYLATYNINFNKPSEGGLKYEELDRLLDSIPAREKLLLIDACHSGEVDKDAETQIVAQTTTEKDVIFRGVKPRGYQSNTTLSYNNSFELMKELFADLRKGTGAVVISSAGGGEFAFEGEQWKNGVFTYSLREGLLSGLADLNKDHQITVSELQKYILENVQKLTGGKQKPTMRQENIENDFGIWAK